MPVTQFDQPALASEHLGREFPAVLAGHGALDALDDGRDWRAVVVELLGDVFDEDAFAAAEMLVVGRLVRILEAPPAADVIDQDDLEIDIAGLDILDQALQRIAAIDVEAATPFIGVGAYDLDAVLLGVFPDLVCLVLRRVLLVVGGHAHVFGGTEECSLYRWLVDGVVAVHAGMPLFINSRSTPGSRHDVSYRLATRARSGFTPSKQVCREHFARTLSARKPPVYTVFSLQSAGLINHPSRAFESKDIFTSHASPFAIPAESQHRNS